MKNKKTSIQAILVLIAFTLGIITTWVTNLPGHIFYLELSSFPATVAIILVLEIFLRIKR